MFKNHKLSYKLTFLMKSKIFLITPTFQQHKPCVTALHFAPSTTHAKCNNSNSARYVHRTAHLVESGLDLDLEFVRDLAGEGERTFGGFFLLRSISSLANSSSGSTGCLVVSTSGFCISISGLGVSSSGLGVSSSGLVVTGTLRSLRTVNS